MRHKWKAIQTTKRHKHYLAHKMNLHENMKVLDVGCGVGGPGREITRFTGCEIVGLNNNDYQIERANHYAKKYKLDDKLSYVKGDFMQMDFAPESFDARISFTFRASLIVPSIRSPLQFHQQLRLL